MLNIIPGNKNNRTLMNQLFRTIIGLCTAHFLTSSLPPYPAWTRSGSAKDSGYGPPTQRLTEDGIIVFQSKPQHAFGVDIDGIAGRDMFKLLSKAYEKDQKARLEYME
jgi:hypothetical protein